MQELILLSGTHLNLNGNTVGIAIYDHPKNPRLLELIHDGGVEAGWGRATLLSHGNPPCPP